MALDWLPTYPHQTVGDLDLGAAYQPYYAAAPLPAWILWMPLQIQFWTWASLRPIGNQAYAANLSPLPNAAAPDQSWQQSLPDPVRRVVRAGEWMDKEVPLLPIIISPPAPWIGTAPDWVPTRTTHPALRLQSWQAAWIREVAVFTWRASFPDRVAPLGPPKWIGGTTFRVDPATVLEAATCVEWTDETVVRPAFTSEVFQRPQFLAGGLDDPQYVLLEDGTVLLLEDGTPMLLETQLGGPEESLVRPMMIEEDWC